MKTLIAVIIGIIGLSGCTSAPTMTISSNPEGAYIEQVNHDDIANQMAPLTLTYDAEQLKARQGEDGCYLVKGFKATWPSGATTKTEDIVHLCGDLYMKHKRTLLRPFDAPGLDIDQRFAQQLKEKRERQRMETIAALGAALRGAGESLQANQPKVVRCTGNQRGPHISLSCRE